MKRCPHCGAPPRVVVLRPLGSEYAAGVVCSANCLEARSASEARARLGAMERWDARAGAPAAEGEVRNYITRRWQLGHRLSFELLTYGGERLIETWRWCVAHGNCDPRVCEFAGRTLRIGRLRVVWWPPARPPACAVASPTPPAVAWSPASSATRPRFSEELDRGCPGEVYRQMSSFLATPCRQKGPR